MIAPELRKKTLKHLQNALKPLGPEELGGAAKWVTFPTKNPADKGGLSPEGKAVFKDDPEMLAAGKTHRENTRVEIHAVLATCSAFVKANSKKSTPEEKAAAKNNLAQGITILIGGNINNTDKIQTSRKNGEILTDRFKGMMARAAGPLQTGCPNLAGVIFAAGTLQKQQEAKAAKLREGIAEMA